MATGHIRKRTNKKGEVTYQITVETDRDPITGERNRTYKTIKGTKKQADATMRQMISEAENGGIVSSSSLTLKSWLETWLQSYMPNIAQTTRAGYEEKITEYIAPKLGHIPISSLTPIAIQTFFNDLSSKGLSAKTVRNTFNILNPALKKAVALRMIQFNPCTGVELPKLVKPKTNIYNSTQITEMLKLSKDTDMHLIAVLCFSLGLRRGELCGLTWNNIDIENRKIDICQNRVSDKKGSVITKAPKSEAGKRQLSIGNDVAEILKKAKTEYEQDKLSLGKKFQDLGYVIRQKDGTPFQPDSLTQKWNRFLKKHNLPHIRFHDSRHSNATALIQAGISPKVVQQRLGHADISITLNTYTHVLPSMDIEAANAIDNLIPTP